MDPFIGQIILVAFGFPPRGYALCDGQLMQISQNQALFSLLGTTYGGDGLTTFALPDLRGRTARHVGNGPGLNPVIWGQKAGANVVRLTERQMPNHTHTATTDVETEVTLHCQSGSGTSNSPVGNVDATEASGFTAPQSTVPNAVKSPDAASAISNAETTVAAAGSGDPVDIQNPYLGLFHVIALTGVFPPRN